MFKHKNVVVKPLNASHGNGVTVGCSDKKSLIKAIKSASKYSKTILVQQQIEGDDYRVLMIDHSLAAAVIRKPAFVVANGIDTVSKLISLENGSDKRNDGYTNTLTSINVANSEQYLGSNAETIHKVGEEVQVIGTANIGTGGMAIDVTDTIDINMVEQSVRLTKHLDMGLCGVDFIVDQKTNIPYLIEINASPSLGLHEYPYIGNARQTPDTFLDWLEK
jgi:cyanophycin synthetase